MEVFYAVKTAKVKTAKLSDLMPDKRNANQGTERGLRMLDDSLRKYGAGRSILVDKDGNVIAGNKTLERAVAVGMGIDNVIIVETDGTQLVAVKRMDIAIDSKRGRELALADNRVAEINLDWDAHVLSALAAEGVDLAALWSDKELALILGAGDEPPADPGAQTDSAEELQQVWQVQRGDVWEIGEHRLVCGDSTSVDDITKVMGDEKPHLILCDPLYESPVAIMDALIEFAPHQCHIFVFGADKQLALMAARHEKLFRRFFAVNMKAVAVTSAYMPLTMLDFVAEFLKGKTNFKNLHDAFSNYLESSKHLENLEFKAKAKQPSLFCEFINHYSDAGDIVLDGFLGSGTTLVSCEQTKRRGRGIEIEPKYCAVTLDRLSRMGITVRRES